MLQKCLLYVSAKFIENLIQIQEVRIKACNESSSQNKLTKVLLITWE